MQFDLTEIAASFPYGFFLMLLMSTIGAIAFYYFEKRKVIITGGSIKVLKIICGIIMAGFIYLALSIYKTDVLLYIDNKLNSVENTTIKPIDISGGNDGTYLYDEEGVKYRAFTLAKSDKDELRECYLNHECKITYYKFSKVLTDIAVLDP